MLSLGQSCFYGVFVFYAREANFILSSQNKLGKQMAKNYMIYIIYVWGLDDTNFAHTQLLSFLHTHTYILH